MPPNQRSEKASETPRALDRDKVGNLYADVQDGSKNAHLRVSFKRKWYSPPLTEAGEVDYEAVASDLAPELKDGTIVVRNYLENGELGFGAEIQVASKDELESTLSTIRRVFNAGLKQGNSIRQAALARCEAKLAQPAKPPRSLVDLRKDIERRLRERRGRKLLGHAWFRRNDRRVDEERRRSPRRRST